MSDKTDRIGEVLRRAHDPEFPRPWFDPSKPYDFPPVSAEELARHARRRRQGALAFEMVRDVIAAERAGWEELED
jgi:hypothetical protein